MFKNSNGYGNYMSKKTKQNPKEMKKALILVAQNSPLNNDKPVLVGRNGMCIKRNRLIKKLINLENNEDIFYSKKGSKIHIKKKNRGKFTDYCGGNVTQNCINRAKKSGNKTLVKRAVFAENARKWKH